MTYNQHFTIKDGRFSTCGGQGVLDGEMGCFIKVLEIYFNPSSPLYVRTIGHCIGIG